MTNHIYESVIIGTGFSGLCMAIKLQVAGIHDFLILEKASEEAGTWRENTYPGAACDVQSHLYSYSFAGNPDWSHVFSGWYEIKAYLKNISSDYGLKAKTQFKCEMRKADFDEKTGVWTVTLQNGETRKGRNLILGTGPLHVPSIPNIKGLDTFKGEVFHSARWNHEIDLTDKNVVSIGTGGSAIQYVPELAKTCKKLTVFQRTAAWVLPRNERAYSGIEKWIFKHAPLVRKTYRTLLYWMNESRVFPMHHPSLIKLAQLGGRLHLRKQVKDKTLRKKLTPNYTIGCKRILISNQYFPAFNRDNVDLNTNGIEQIKANSVVDKHHNEVAADVIVLGTGFVTDPTQYMKDMPITGLNGKTLLETWIDGAESYYGISVAGFPNFYQMVGPNTGLGHNSVVFMIEAQVRYILDGIKQRKQKDVLYSDVKPEVMQRFNQKIQKDLQGTVWQTGCASWYKRDDGKNFTIWPATTYGYAWQTRNIKHKNFNWVKQTQQKQNYKQAS